MSKITKELNVMVTSFRVWIQSQWYEHIEALPTLSELGDYIRITEKGTKLPFNESTDELKVGEFLLVADANNLGNGTVYRISKVRGYILRYSQIDIAKYWSLFSDVKTFDEAYYTNATRRLNDIAETESIQDAVDDFAYLTSIGMSVLGNIDVNPHVVKAFRTALKRTHVRLIQHILRERVPYVFTEEIVADMDRFVTKAKECPWLPTAALAEITKGLYGKERNLLSLHYGNNVLNVMKIAVLEYDSRIFAVTSENIFEVLEKNTLEPRVFNLL